MFCNACFITLLKDYAITKVLYNTNTLYLDRSMVAYQAHKKKTLNILNCLFKINVNEFLNKSFAFHSNIDSLNFKIISQLLI